MKPEVKNQIIAQLEKKGYSVTNKKRTYLANHEAKTPFFFYEYKKGLLFYCMYNITDYAQKNRLEYLSFIDQLNRKSDVTKFHDYEDVMVGIFWIYGTYDKKEFTHLLKLWEGDLTETPCSIEGFDKILVREN